MTITSHKRVRDRSVPCGVAAVRYRVRARRTTGKTSGWSNTAEVRFGCGPCGDFAAATGFGEPSPRGKRGAA